MRTKHDTIPDWVFTDKSGKPPLQKERFTWTATISELAMDMFYGELGWDRATGAPTDTTYRRLGLGEVARDLGKLKLLP